MSHQAIILGYGFLAGQLKHLIFSVIQNKYWNTTLLLKQLKCSILTFSE